MMSTSRADGIHVLTLTPFYPSLQDDAAGCFVSEPLAWLGKDRVTHTIIGVQPFYRAHLSPHPAAPPAEYFSYFSFPANFGLPTSGTFLFARLVSSVRQRHRAHPIDLIHAHGPLPCGHAAALLSRRLGIPFVVSVHGLDAFSTVQVGGYAGGWCRRISNIVYGSAHRVICISEHVRQQISAGASVAPSTSVVYNGVDPTAFLPANDTQPRSLVILSIGNLIPIKGHALLLQAVARLKAKYRTLSCDIIGDGPERSPLADLAAQLSISDSVRFLGRQSRRAVAKSLQQCTVFALPSRYEGLGCVYLEAMAAAKTPVACRGQGIQEIIQHGVNGFLVGPDNVEELTCTLSDLLCDCNLRDRVGSAARSTVLQGFTLSHQADRLRRIYQECLA